MFQKTEQKVNANMSTPSHSHRHMINKHSDEVYNFL